MLGWPIWGTSIAITFLSRLDGAGPSDSDKDCDYFVRTVTYATATGPGEKAGGL
jgi:hypothetical protein